MDAALPIVKLPRSHRAVGRPAPARATLALALLLSLGAVWAQPAPPPGPAASAGASTLDAGPQAAGPAPVQPTVAARPYGSGYESRSLAESSQPAASAADRKDKLPQAAALGSRPVWGLRGAPAGHGGGGRGRR